MVRSNFSFCHRRQILAIYPALNAPVDSRIAGIDRMHTIRNLSA